MCQPLCPFGWRTTRNLSGSSRLGLPSPSLSGLVYSRWCPPSHQGLSVAFGAGQARAPRVRRHRRPQGAGEADRPTLILPLIGRPRPARVVRPIVTWRVGADTLPGPPGSTLRNRQQVPESHVARLQNLISCYRLLATTVKPVGAGKAESTITLYDPRPRCRGQERPYLRPY